MLHDKKNDLYKIQKPKTVADFIEEKDEYKDCLFNKFKQIRKEFFICFSLTLIFAFLLWYLLIGDGLYNNAVLTFIIGMVLAALIAVDIKSYKGFKEEKMRFAFRVHSLLDRYMKQGIILNFDEDEITKTTEVAYKKYGIKKRWLIYFFVSAAVLIAIGLSISLSIEKFTPKKWKDIDKRPKFAFNIIYEARASLDDYNTNKNELKYDFSKMSNVEIHTILGNPEVAITSNYKGNTITKNSTYQEYMGEPLIFTYLFDNRAQTAVCEEYYCGISNGGEAPTWFCLIYLDDKLKYAVGGVELMTDSYNYEINEKFFSKDFFKEQKNGD